MMSILNYSLTNERNMTLPERSAMEEERYQRDALGDIKHGLDMIFELKMKIDKMHPLASSTLIRLLTLV